MRIVIDSNRVIASLIKDSTTREILFDNHFKFFTPSFIKTEISKYKHEIIKKTGLDEDNFDKLFDVIFEHIAIIPNIEYEKYLDELSKEVKDKKDLPYFAAFLRINADGIWTHDPHFQEQKRCRILTNIDLLKISGKSKNQFTDSP